MLLAPSEHSGSDGWHGPGLSVVCYYPSRTQNIMKQNAVLFILEDWKFSQKRIESPVHGILTMGASGNLAW